MNRVTTVFLNFVWIRSTRKKELVRGRWRCCVLLPDQWAPSPSGSLASSMVNMPLRWSTSCSPDVPLGDATPTWGRAEDPAPIGTREFGWFKSKVIDTPYVSFLSPSSSKNWVVLEVVGRLVGQKEA